MNITQNGIALVNKDRQQQVEYKAMTIINRIAGYQASIKTSEDAIKLNQEAVAKLSLDVLDYSKVVGTTAPTAPNENQSTILRAIAESNKKKQDVVESQSRQLITQIESQRTSIKALNDAIAKDREELAKLSVEVVEEKSIVGK